MGLEDKTQQEVNPPETVEGVLMDFSYSGDFEHYSVIEMIIKLDDGTLLHPAYLVEESLHREYMSTQERFGGKSGLLEKMLGKKVRFTAPQKVTIDYPRRAPRTRSAYSRLQILDKPKEE